MDEKDILAASITKALAYAENGGAPNIDNPSAGKSGEMKSIFQYTPNTWHAVAAKYLGNANTPLTADSETQATLDRVKDWIGQGYNTSQIASMWNAGEGKPNAYKENWKGTNAEGVSYDTPAYASKVLDYAKQFYAQKSAQAASSASTPPTQTPTSPVASTPTPTTTPSPLGNIQPTNALRGQLANIVANTGPNSGLMAQAQTA